METFICKECGKEETLRWIPERNAELLANQECFSCNHFLSILRRKDQSDCFRIKGTHYMAAPESKQMPKQFRGFGGRLFKIVPFDGRPAFLSDNVWCQGEIPEHLRSRMPDNASFGNPDE